MLPLSRFTQFITQHGLFEPADTLLAALSGGMDSVLLVHLLKAAGYNFGIAHCNFTLRGAEADADQQFCAALAKQLSVPFHTVSFNTAQYAAENKVSVQMAARELRYGWFEQVRQQYGYSAVALGHHKNDTIETILLNLTRGTGIAGLHGILPQNGTLVRPLLGFTRQEIAGVIESEKLAYVEDSSNASVKYARNKIRHDVVPKLKELNPNLEQTFESNLRNFRELETLLEQKVDELRREIFVYEGDEIYLAAGAVRQLNPQRLLLFKLMQDFGFNETVVNDLLACIDGQPGKIFESLTHRMVFDRDNIIISPKLDLPIQPVIIQAGDTEADFSGYKLNILHDDSPLIVRHNPLAVSVDAEKVVFPLTIRSWQQGDYFYPLGMKMRKKLSDFFVGEKIPLHKKSRIPLLVNGNGDIMWVAGYRPDERYKVSDNTKKVAIFELFKLT